jgi:hypothetical protein
MSESRGMKEGKLGTRVDDCCHGEVVEFVEKGKREGIVLWQEVVVEGLLEK